MNPFDLRYQPLLSKLAFRYKNRDYIAQDIFKTVPVDLDTGLYTVWDDDVTFRVPDTSMSHYASANQIDVAMSRAQFTLDEHALKVHIDPAEVRQAGGLEPVRAVKVDALMDNMLLKLEDEVATTLANASIFSTGETLTSTDQWTDYTNSDPRKKIQDVAAAMLVEPNTLVVSQYGYNALLNHTKVIEAMKYTTPTWKSGDILAAYLGVDRIVVGRAFKNTAKKGQSKNLQPIWGKHAWLIHVAAGQPSTLMDQPSAGYLPTWNKGGRGLYRMYTWRNPDMGTEEGAETVKVEATYKPLVSAPQFAYRLTNAFA